MNTKPIDAIANAVLYEGYMLYPYRPSSVKNRQRFNFGVLYPRSYSEAQTGLDAWRMQTECLVQGGFATAIDVRVRFLKLVARSVRKVTEPAPPMAEPPGFETVPRLEVDGKVFTHWQEAIEREVTVPACNLDALTQTPVELAFAFPAKEEMEVLRDAHGRVVGMIARKQESVQGMVEILAERAGDGLFKIQVQVKNLTSCESDAGEIGRGRDSALMRSLVSAHTLLGVADGQFVSLLEPPENLKEVAASCQNVGVWPVLVGGEGERGTMLASPIILYDYPQIAPESPGDLFDGTEIDEILALRILTMTDAEKSEMRNSDDRARKMLERTENLPMEHLMKLHGTLRELRPSELRPLNEEMP
jgi:hydrogenase maturation protease